AELIESAPVEDSDPWLAATLWAGAAETDRAIACAVRSADALLLRGDPAGAASHLGYALRMLPRAEPRRLDLRRRPAEALTRAGMYAAAARAAGAAVRLARDEGERASGLALQAMALVQAGRFRSALGASERAAARAAEVGNLEALARARKAAGVGLGRL